jgi:hypothetical protein
MDHGFAVADQLVDRAGQFMDAAGLVAGDPDSRA